MAADLQHHADDHGSEFPDVTFNHRWDQDRYTTFRKKIGDYSAWVTEAYDETDKDKSVELWQRVFGRDFKAPVSTASATPAVAKAAPIREARAPQEQFIEERGFTYNLTHVATIDATVARRAGFRHGSLRAMGTVGKGDPSTSASGLTFLRRTRSSGRSATSAPRLRLLASCAASSKTEPPPTPSGRAPPTWEPTGSSATSSRTASFGQLTATWSGSGDGRGWPADGPDS